LSFGSTIKADFEPRSHFVQILLLFERSDNLCNPKQKSGRLEHDSATKSSKFQTFQTFPFSKKSKRQIHFRNEMMIKKFENRSMSLSLMWKAHCSIFTVRISWHLTHLVLYFNFPFGEMDTAMPVMSTESSHKKSSAEFFLLTRRQCSRSTVRS
jgi:hypothetical protein